MRLLFWILALAACSSPTGETAVVPSDSDADSDLDSDSDSDSDRDLSAIPDPGFPDFPDVVDTISVSVRTGGNVFDGTDDRSIQLCVTEDACVPFDVPDVDDLQSGQVDVYHRSGLSLQRGEIDRVQLKTSDGSNRWTPACIEVALDGQSIYCNDALDVDIGSGRGEVMSWTDPTGAGTKCSSCAPRGSLTHGPIVGDTGPNHTSIWVRTDATRQVALRMADREDLDDAPIVAWAYPGPESDFTAVMRVEGLRPDTTWHYAIEVNEERVHQASFRTPPSAPGKHTLALGSCSKFEDQPVFRAIDTMAPQVMVFLGDNHYGDTPHLAAHRWNYRWQLDRRDRARLLDHTVTVAGWDDHDFVGNNTDGTDAGGDEALRAFQEYWANPHYGTTGAEGAYTRFRWGEVELFIVDGRTWRNVDGMLGRAQTAWLVDAVRTSDARFKLIASGSQWTASSNDENWSQFRTERDALFDALHEHGVEGVVLLAGDVHRSEFRWIERKNGYDLPEITASPLATWRSPCFGGVVDCYSKTDSFVFLSIDTSLDDPALIATIHDVDGGEQAWWRIRLSKLQ